MRIVYWGDKMGNNKKRGFFLKKYSKPIPQLKEHEYQGDCLIEKGNHFSTFEVVIIIFISILFGFVVACILNFADGTLIGRKLSAKEAEFISTYSDIVNNYYDSVDEDALMDAAISGMITSLEDSNSTFMDSYVTEDFNQTVYGEYVGIGTLVSWQEGKTVIVEVLEDSPAEKAGMKVGDEIIKIGKTDVTNLSFEEISDLMRGEEGTTAKYTVNRDGTEVTLKITRGKIVVQSVTGNVYEKNGKKIGYLYIENFAANTAGQFEKELKKLEKKDIDSLIIDVRGNPGGNLGQVTEILDLFLKKKVVLYQVESKDNKQKIYSTTKESRNYPIAVLVDYSSASASEILAVSLRDNYEDVTTIGLTTYGKGTIQTAKELSSGSSIKYTTQRWLTSSGKSLDGTGYTPDIEIPIGDVYCENPTDENDGQLQKAIEVLSQKESK